MKSIITFLLFSIFCFAQTAEFNNLNKQGKFQEYISESGISFKVGDKIKIGLPSSGNVYTFITQANQPCGAIISNRTVSISKIRIFGNKKIGYKAYLLFLGFGLSCYIDIENAIKVQEVIITQ
jgi:hypothetical protein